MPRFGPVLAVVALLIGVGVVATVKGHGTSSTELAATTGKNGSASGATQDVARTYDKNPRLPVLYSAAKKAGRLDEFDWGDHCDPKTGRLAIPSVYDPPCVPKWNGDKPWVDQGAKLVTDNGGRTAPGVSEDEIVVAVYKPSPQDITATLQAFGVLDPPDVAQKGIEQLVAAANGQYELYGRKVVVKPFQASGDGKTRATAQADARKVADDMGAFASIGGPTQTPAYQDELARRHVMCIGCGYSTPDKKYQEDAPYANVFWDSKAEGPDEQNKPGTGMYRYAAGGQRLLLNEIPKVDTSILFSNTADAPTILDKIPKQDRTPDYKPWPTSPNAKGGGN